MGSFSAPLQPVFVGTGQVFLRGDSAGRIYPQWFGAVSDGTADADAAIQQAIDSRLPLLNDGHTGVSTVFLPPGIYSVGKPIELPSYVHLEGASPVSTRLIANSTSRPRALLAPPNRGLNRTDGWRLGRFALTGVGSDVGLLFAQTSSAIVNDVVRTHPC